MRKQLFSLIAAVIVALAVGSSAAYAESGSGKTGTGNTDDAKSGKTKTDETFGTEKKTDTSGKGDGGKTVVDDTKKDSPQSGRSNTSGDTKGETGPRTEAEHQERLGHFGLKEVERKKLDDREAKLCEAKKPAINDAMDGVRQRSGDRFERLTKLTDMVKEFYVGHDLIVAKYDELVAAVDAAKATALTAKDELTDQPAFDCTTDGPKADIQVFELKRQEKIEAFKAYRDAVKALADAVRQAADAQKEGAR